MHVLKVVLEGVGILAVVAVLIAIIVGAVLMHDYDSGGNPFQ